MRINKFICLIFTTLVLLPIQAQMSNPVKFTVSQKMTSSNEVEVSFHGTISAGWHVYSVNLPSGGPTSANMNTEKAEGASAVGKLEARGKEISVYDKMFGMNVRYFENKVLFVQKYKITANTYHIKGYMEYGACNDVSCMPPTPVEFDFTGKGKADNPSNAPVKSLKKTDTTSVIVQDTVAYKDMVVTKSD